MKKKLCILSAVLLIIAVLCGCAASTSDAASPEMNSAGKADSPVGYDDAAYDVAESYDSDEQAPMDSDAFTSEVGKQNSLAEKIIYSAYAEIETVKFDESIDKIYELIEKYQGFVESSRVSGSTYNAEYYGYQTYRWAEFIIRVPYENYSGMTGRLEELGIVTSRSTDIENITEQFYDAQARLDTYKTEEERLLAMLEKSDTVADMIEIESRISQVRYEIESLQSTLKNWQNEVDYSTVTIYLNEVEELREVVEKERTYWQEIRDGFKSSVKSVGRFFKDLFKEIIIALPVLLILAAFIIVIIVIIRAVFGRKAKEKRAVRAEKKKIADKKENKENPEDKEGS